MPYKPYSEEERANILSQIKGAEKEIQARLNDQSARKIRLEQGKWYDDTPEEEYNLMAKDCKAFSEWLDKGCVGDMPRLYHYKFSGISGND